jgi:uncharacterized FlgJ-related protein
MKPSKMKLISIILLLIISTNTSVGSTRIARTQQVDNITVSKLISSVCSLPFKYKKIIVAQGILETGWFQSKNFKINNNLFGMKPPKNRITTSDSSINGYAHYQNWQFSIIDYYLLLAVRNDVQHIKSEAEYYKFVDQIYSEMGHSYSDQLKDIIRQLNLDQLDPKITISKRSNKNRKKKHR